MVLIILFGCTLNRYGRYTKKKFKTKNDKVIVIGTIYRRNKSKEILPGAGIKSADTGQLILSDRDGKYRIELQEGEYRIHATAVGFESTSTKPFKLVNGDSIVVDFILKEVPSVFVD